MRFNLNFSVKFEIYWFQIVQLMCTLKIKFKAQIVGHNLAVTSFSAIRGKDIYNETIYFASFSLIFWLITLVKQEKLSRPAL